MSRFFSDKIFNDVIEITGDDAKHISKVLRMSIGQSLTVCDLKGNDYDCKIKSIEINKIVLKIERKFKSNTESDIRVNLYQGFPKGNKFDFIVKKSVELGVNEITPVIMSRCIPQLEDNNKCRKIDRYNKIAFEAAKQSNRSKLPVVNNFLSYIDTINKVKQDGLTLLFYENSELLLKPVLSNVKSKYINIIIGPEGGFEKSEIEIAKSEGLNIVSMGKRILRCETAPIYALSAIMFALES